MENSWTTREALASDAELIAVHACHRPEDEGRRAGYAEWLGPRIGSGRYLGLLATHEEVVVGGAGVVLLDWGPTRANPGGRMGRVANVFTAPAWRRQGIARSLLGRLLTHCEALGVHEFNLGTTPEARSLYRSLGFIDYAAEMRRRRG
ncbi:MAG: GNAT family N-acetyltransferase [Burkholderiales bacterium]|jgi:GNAT superfamily N-acetyltransferase|nr:GNAT family N-acetyltransferase [Burkholderiales bacterium]